MELSDRPFRFDSNRIAYLIKGGELIDQFLGIKDSGEEASQLWIASTVTCTLHGSKDSRSYLSREDGAQCFPELLKTQSKRLLGEHHVDTYGAELGILLKLLNSKDRLLVQAHPNGEKAKKYFDSPFGKTEAWYVLDQKPGPAYVYAGFKEYITRDYFKSLILQKDSGAILNCLYRFEIHPGDVILIPAGLVHTIGPDSLIAEIQEPTDLTLRAENIRPDGSVLPEESMHSGIGIDGMLDCFEFSGESKEEVRNRIFLTPQMLRTTDGGLETSLITYEDTPCFAMNKIHCTECYEKENDSFVIALVLSGEGNVRVGDVTIGVKKGTEFMIPYGVQRYCYSTLGSMEVLECYPPVSQRVMKG